jgi:arginyl-tRNA synthetase
MERFKLHLAEALGKAIESPVTPAELEIPPDRTMGDFAFPCFKLSKALRKAPPMIAQEIAAKVASLISDHEFTVKAVGPYVNFTILNHHLIATVLKDILRSEADRPYGSLAKKSRPKWIFEYSSPNVAKPFQIYHLRTTIVGSALSKIARLRGYDVTTINHLGDWGTQYGKLAIALEKYKSTLPAELNLKDLVSVYVQIHKDMETDDTIEPAAQQKFLELEQGKPEMLAIWQKCVDVSIKDFKKTYARYQVEFDHYWGESFYQDQLKPLTDDLKKRGIMIKDQGAWIVKVESRNGNEIPPCIMEKSDGASIYATRDVAAAIYRHEKFNFQTMSYIVGKEQILHFEQVFGVLRAMGFDWEKRCEHLPTGLYRFKDAKMSTRKGNFVTLDEVNEMCVEKALKLMNDRYVEKVIGIDEADRKIVDTHKLNDEEIRTIADQVAIGALVFADLSTDPTKDLDFDVDRVISFEGETGPYLQYAHTRCLSILKKSGIDATKIRSIDSKIVAEQCHRQEEIFLLKMLGRFPSVLERTLEQRKPTQLTTYLIDLTRDFGAFYRECKVMNADDETLTLARLSLVEATRQVMALGLDLLGIPKPEKM